MRKLISSITALCMATTMLSGVFTPAGVSAADPVEYKIDTVETQPGQTVTVPVLVNNLQDENAEICSRANIELSDAAKQVLTYNGYDKGTVFPADNFMVQEDLLYWGVTSPEPSTAADGSTIIGWNFQVADKDAVEAAAKAANLQLSSDGYYTFPITWGSEERDIATGIDQQVEDQITFTDGGVKIFVGAPQTTTTPAVTTTTTTPAPLDGPTWMIGGELNGESVDPVWVESGEEACNIDVYAFKQGEIGGFRVAYVLSEGLRTLLENPYMSPGESVSAMGVTENVDEAAGTYLYMSSTDGVATLSESGDQLVSVEFEATSDPDSVKAAAQKDGLSLQTGTYNGRTVQYYAFPISIRTGYYIGYSEGQEIQIPYQENLDADSNRVDTNLRTNTVNIIVSAEETTTTTAATTTTTTTTTTAATTTTPAETTTTVVTSTTAAPDDNSPRWEIGAWDETTGKTGAVWCEADSDAKVAAYIFQQDVLFGVRGAFDMSTELESILTDAYFSPGDAVSTLGLSYYDPQHSLLCIPDWLEDWNP